MDEENVFKQVDKILNRAIPNISQSMYDDIVKENVDFRAKAGLEEKIIRSTDGHCCEWCNEIAGTYTYGEEPREIYQRHDHCGCTVTHKSSKGYFDVHSKKYVDDKRGKELEDEIKKIYPKKERLVGEELEKQIELEQNKIKDRIKNPYEKSNLAKYKTGIFTSDEYAQYRDDIKFAEKIYNEIYLEPAEREHVISEFNTHLSTEQRKSAIITKAVGNYIYKAINYGFSDYKFIEKEFIK